MYPGTAVAAHSHRADSAMSVQSASRGVTEPRSASWTQHISLPQAPPLKAVTVPRRHRLRPYPRTSILANNDCTIATFPASLDFERTPSIDVELCYG